MRIPYAVWIPILGFDGPRPEVYGTGEHLKGFSPRATPLVWRLFPSHRGCCPVMWSGLHPRYAGLKDPRWGFYVEKD